MTKEEATQRFVSAASFFKLTLGIANNAAWMVALEALDHVRTLNHYRHAVKLEWKQVTQKYHDYEQRLLSASNFRLFHLNDMPAEARRLYGNISDREYYDFWCASGSEAYKQTRPLITSLWNKHRLCLINHQVPHEEEIAWALCANDALDIAAQLYDHALNDCFQQSQLPKHLLKIAFAQLSFSPIATAWRNALVMTEPRVPRMEAELTSTEHKNLTHGREQIIEAWVDPDGMYDCIQTVISDYDEVWATKGFQAKAIAQVEAVRNETYKELMQ